MGITDTDDANVARIEGKPIGVVIPDVDGMGTLVIPNCAVLIQGGPNSDAGRRFIDFLLQPETEKALAESEAAQMPLRPGVPTPENVMSVSQMQTMSVEYDRLSGLLDELSKGYLKEWVGRQ